jgi:hypothetical protein
MDGSIYTVVETVKELDNTLRDCFENKNNLTFQLTGHSMLPGIPRIPPKMEYKLNVNQYGDVVFILEIFNKRKNVYYRMHLRDGIEQIYKMQTVTDEIKTKINGVNNIYKAVPFGYDGILSNYIVKMIRIPNTDYKITYRFMDIFEIID